MRNAASKPSRSSPSSSFSDRSLTGVSQGFGRRTHGRSVLDSYRKSARFAEPEHHLRGAQSRTHRKIVARCAGALCPATQGAEGIRPNSAVRNGAPSGHLVGSWMRMRASMILASRTRKKPRSAIVEARYPFT
jgi:hypothetical protein